MRKISGTVWLQWANVSQKVFLSEGGSIHKESRIITCVARRVHIFSRYYEWFKQSYVIDTLIISK